MTQARKVDYKVWYGGRGNPRPTQNAYAKEFKLKGHGLNTIFFKPLLKGRRFSTDIEN